MMKIALVCVKGVLGVLELLERKRERPRFRERRMRCWVLNVASYATYQVRDFMH